MLWRSHQVVLINLKKNKKTSSHSRITATVVLFCTSRSGCSNWCVISCIKSVFFRVILYITVKMWTRPDLEMFHFNLTGVLCLFFFFLIGSAVYFWSLKFCLNSFSLVWFGVASFNKVLPHSWCRADVKHFCFNCNCFLIVLNSCYGYSRLILLSDPNLELQMESFPSQLALFAISGQLPWL